MSKHYVIFSKYTPTKTNLEVLTAVLRTIRNYQLYLVENNDTSWLVIDHLLVLEPNENIVWRLTYQELKQAGGNLPGIMTDNLPVKQGWQQLRTYDDNHNLMETIAFYDQTPMSLSSQLDDQFITTVNDPLVNDKTYGIYHSRRTDRYYVVLQHDKLKRGDQWNIINDHQGLGDAVDKAIFTTAKQGFSRFGIEQLSKVHPNQDSSHNIYAKLLVYAGRWLHQLPRFYKLIVIAIFYLDFVFSLMLVISSSGYRLFAIISGLLVLIAAFAIAFKTT